MAAPTRPKKKPTAAAKPPAAPDPEPGVRQWDVYLAEVLDELEPWRMQLPDGEQLAVTCPSADQIDALARAQAIGDSNGMLVAVFGPELAPKLMALTGAEPWVLRLRLCNDVMMFFGLSLANLPE